LQELLNLLWTVQSIEGNDLIRGFFLVRI
jgi:hypothetical protein